MWVGRWVGWVRGFITTVLHVESVPTGLLRASFSSSTLSPGHEGVSDVSGSMGNASEYPVQKLNQYALD